MRKVKKIIKRLRARADELRLKAIALQDARRFSAADVIRDELVAEVLQEVADQLAPRSKTSLKKMMEGLKAAKKAKKVKALTPSPNNGVTHEPSDAHVRPGVGG